MKSFKRHYELNVSTLFCILLSLFSLSVSADEHTQKDVKTNNNYVSFGIALNEFRSIELVLSEFVTSNKGVTSETVFDRQFPLVAQTYGASFAVGTYITDHFRTELRYGTGIRKDTIGEALDININYIFNWYIGATQPLTDYMSVYALYGVSFYDADVTRRQVIKLINQNSQTQAPRPAVLQPSTTEMEEGLFGTRFSSTWMLGLDFNVADQWHLAFEYGQLINDTNSNIKVYQAGTYLRYDY